MMTEKHVCAPSVPGYLTPGDEYVCHCGQHWIFTIDETGYWDKAQ